MFLEVVDRGVVGVVVFGDGGSTFVLFAKELRVEVVQSLQPLALVLFKRELLAFLAAQESCHVELLVFCREAG